MKIKLSKSQWQFIGKKTGWMKTAAFGEQAKQKFLKQYPNNEEEINSYIKKFDEIRKSKPKELFEEIPNVTISPKQRQDITAYSTFEDFKNVINYIEKNKEEKEKNKEEENPTKYKKDGITIYRPNSSTQAGKIAKWNNAGTEAWHQPEMYEWIFYSDLTLYMVKNDHPDYFLVIAIKGNNEIEQIQDLKTWEQYRGGDWEKEKLEKWTGLEDIMHLLVNVN